MNRSTISAIAATLLIALLGITPVPADARQQRPPVPMDGPFEGIFYELTESMKLIPRTTQTFRVATSALRGQANLGTPFCPTDLLAAYEITVPGYKCDLVAIGSDRIDTTTGLGTFEAKIDIILPGDNPADGPEFVIGTIKVSGQMDFSPAIFLGQQYGTINGKVLNAGPGQPKRFSGVFRLPFVRDSLLVPGLTYRQAICPTPVTDPPTPDHHNPNFPLAYDLAYNAAPNGSGCVDIAQDEVSYLFGRVTAQVRFELWFE